MKKPKKVKKKKKAKKNHKRRKNPKIIILYISIFILNVMSYGRDNICTYVNNKDEKSVPKK